MVVLGVGGTVFLSPSKVPDHVHNTRQGPGSQESIHACLMCLRKCNKSDLELFCHLKNVLVKQVGLQRWKALYKC